MLLLHSKWPLNRFKVTSSVCTFSWSGHKPHPTHPHLTSQHWLQVGTGLVSQSPSAHCNTHHHAGHPTIVFTLQGSTSQNLLWPKQHQTWDNPPATAYQALELWAWVATPSYQLPPFPYSLGTHSRFSCNFMLSNDPVIVFFLSILGHANFLFGKKIKHKTN